MKLDITVCISILEACLENIEVFNKNNEAILLLKEIHKRKLTLHTKLEIEYEEYFKKSRPELLDLYHNFISSSLINLDDVNILTNYVENPLIEQIPLTNYFKTLLNICDMTKDKIVFSNLLNGYIPQLMPLGIDIYDNIRILDTQGSHILNEYRIPIIRKIVKRGHSCLSLSNWLSRFLVTESNFIIIDGYIYENSDGFFNYFLNNVKSGSKITLYTLLNNGNTIANIVNKFNSPPFKNWNFEIFIIPNKRVQHARDILTDNYYIEIDKGMGVFTRSGNTDQANIAVEYKNKIADKSLPLNCSRVL